jgi:hypothetical protein
MSNEGAKKRPADGNFALGECYMWFNPTAGSPTVVFKGRDLNGNLYHTISSMTPG